MLRGVFIFYFFRDIVRTYAFFFFSILIDTLFLLCDSKPCIYFELYIYDEIVITFFHLYLYVSFVFSLYAHASHILYAIFYFCFTLRCHDKFCLKYFRNTGCHSLSCHELSSCKVFQEFVLG